MVEKKIDKVKKALGLQRQIVGIRFLVFERDYRDSEGTETADTSLCQLVQKAGNGEYVKAKKDSFRCMQGAYALGICEIPEEVSSGRADYNGKRYESLAVARQIFGNRQCINQHIYGVEVAPLDKMHDADIGLIIGTAKDVMRVMQGYVKYYGVAQNVVSVGNCGVCSELISKPFMNNDMNVSLLSRCARKEGDFGQEEMGVSMPIHQLIRVMDGILETVNLTENNRPKREILERLDDPEELGFPIIMNYDYGDPAAKYKEYCDECEKEISQ